jgi:hypothetical protein
MEWSKTRPRPAIDLAGSNLLPCTLEDLPGAREAVDIRIACGGDTLALRRGLDAIERSLGAPGDPSSAPVRRPGP